MGESRITTIKLKNKRKLLDNYSSIVKKYLMMKLVDISGLNGKCRLKEIRTVFCPLKKSLG